MSEYEYKKVEGMTAYQAVDMLIGRGDYFVEENESFYPFENEYPAEVLNRYINEGKIYTRKETPWWEGCEGSVIMVVSSGLWALKILCSVEKFHTDSFTFYCNDKCHYKQARPLTTAERDAIKVQD
jgi:hypothetical protein